MTETSMMSKELTWVGRSIPRKDGTGKVTGETKFFSDMTLPNMLWAKAVRSKHPHALIKKIDTTKAELVPGVVTVLTHKDVPGLNRVRHRYARPTCSLFGQGQIRRRFCSSSCG